MNELPSQGLTADQRAAIERRLTRRAAESPPLSSAQITAQEPRVEYPLSFEQQRLWFLYRLEPGSSAYVVAHAYRVHGDLQIDALRRATQSLAERHAPLRARFRERDGVPSQSYPNDNLPGWAEIRTEGPPEASARRVREILHRERSRSFDLLREPPFRALVIHVGPNHHVFFFALHHIITDGWSTNMVNSELRKLYEADISGRPAALAPLPITFGDYVLWQREQSADAEHASHVDYWAKQLRGFPLFVDLPIDRPRPRRPSTAGGSVPVEIGASIYEPLLSFCARNHVSQFMVGLAAWQCLLRRSGAESRFIVGAPVAGRRQKETEPLCGFFANTVALRADLDGDPSFLALVQRLKRTVLDGLQHQQAPLEEVVRKLKPARSLGHAPVVQTAVGLLDRPTGSFSLPGATVEELVMPAADVPFELALLLEAGGDGLVGRLEFQTDLFDHDSAKRLERSYRSLLASALADPSRRISEIGFGAVSPAAGRRKRPSAERQAGDGASDAPRRVIEAGMGATRSIPPQPVHQLFESQARRSPERIAVMEGDKATSYWELDHKAQCVATSLRRRGVRQGSIVGLALPRSTQQVIAALGVLKAGGAYLPIEEGEPPERLRQILEQSSPAGVICSTANLDRLRGCQCELLPIDDVMAGDAEDAPEWIEPVTSQDAAYVMFTSGSTGKPKGVIVPHRGVIRLLFGVEYVRLGAEETILHMASPAFDASTFEVWGALLHGGMSVIMPVRHPTPREIGQVIDRHRVTTAFLTTSLFNVIVDGQPSALRGLRQLLVGGEALSVAHVCRALDALPNTKIINGYGPTECTTLAVAYTTPRDLPTYAPSVPLGRPIANTEAHVLDERREPVPAGIPGELYLGGPGLALGYLNEPELTRERFIPHPFSTSPGSRLYRTGDKARRLNDGTIEYLGRLDTQVKIRGFRIELGEIEQQLVGHSSVEQAAAVVQESEIAGKRIVAYVTRAKGIGASPTALRDYLRPRLPDYMLPSQFVALDRLPLTINGKIDRKALPYPAEPVGSSTPEEPTDDLEEQLISIWSDTLGVRRVNPVDNFFDLGGHSLLAIKLVSRVCSRLDKTVTIAALFEAPTPRQMANLIREGVLPGSFQAPVQPPFMCVGMGPMFRPLAARLGENRPFFGIGLTASDIAQLDPPYTFEKLAGRLADLLIRHHPNGNYVLGGWCLDAILAYETARQLQSRGRPASLVVLFDSSDPQRLGQLARPLGPGRLWERLRLHARRLKDLPLRQAPRYVAERAGGLRKHWQRASWVGAHANRDRSQGHMAAVVYSAACSYEPQPLDAPVALIIPDDSPSERTRDLPASWQPLVGSRLRVYETAGDHSRMFEEPYVQVLAELLRKILGDQSHRNGRRDVV